MATYEIIESGVYHSPATSGAPAGDVYYQKFTGGVVHQWGICEWAPTSSTAQGNGYYSEILYSPKLYYKVVVDTANVSGSANQYCTLTATGISSTGQWGQWRLYSGRTIPTGTTVKVQYDIWGVQA